MIAPAFLDELRQRTDLPALVGGSVKLQRSGREWKGCCPFHGEKTPSFYVYADHYHCFGCGAHGDGVRWLTEKQGLSFPDAVRELAAVAGLEMPAASPEARAKAERAATLRDAVEAAARWFAEQLWGADGGAGRAYLERRGVSRATAAEFGLGFAPDSRGRLRRALSAMGDPLLIEAGLLVQPDDGEPYDRFRGRLIFPIRDPRGRAIGFGGRALGDVTPKYLNSPDTPLFDKGRTLWNLDRAAAPARTKGRLIVVEGYMDAIALAGAGVGEVVAPLGTALTEAQLALAWRLVPEPLLCFDGDAAGARAAAKAAARALPGLVPGRSLRFVALPAGQDPDDLVRSEGIAAFEVLAAAAEPLHEALWRGALDATDLATPEGRAAIKARLDALAAEIADPAVREQYAILFRDRFWEAFGWRRPGEATRRAPSPSAPHRLPRTVVNEVHAALVGLMNLPHVASDNAEAVAGLPIANNRLMMLRNALVDAVIWEPELDRLGLDAAMVRAGLASLARWARDTHALDYSFTSPACDPARAEAQLKALVATLCELETNYIARLAARRELRELDAEGEEEALQARRSALFDRIGALIEARKAIYNTLYAFAQDAGADPDLRARTRTIGEKHGEDERSDGGTDRGEGVGRRAAHRPQ